MGLCRGKQVALDAARGLAYLHRKRIAWLDCKSSNVLLTRSVSACVLPPHHVRPAPGAKHALMCCAPAMCARALL